MVVQTSRDAPTSEDRTPRRSGSAPRCWVLDRLVPEGHLGVGERRAAARAVRGHLVGLHEQPALVETLERPPDRLDVGRIHRPVGVVHVDPEADPPRQVLPVLHVAAHRLPASLVELGDPEGLDVPLAGGPDLLLDLDLDGEPVAVPSGLAVHEVAGHRPVPRVDVLEGAGEGVADVRPGVRGRRPVVEDPLRRALALRDGAVEDVGLVPEAQDARLELGEPHLRVHRPEPGLVLRHPSASRRAKRLVLASRGRGGAAVPPRLPDASRRPAARGRDHACRCHGRTRLRLPRAPRSVRTGARG